MSNQPKRGVAYARRMSSVAEIPEAVREMARNAVRANVTRDGACFTLGVSRETLDELLSPYGRVSKLTLARLEARLVASTHEDKAKEANESGQG